MRERLRVSLEKNSTLEEELNSTKDEVSVVSAQLYSTSTTLYLLQLWAIFDDSTVADFEKK